MTELEQAQRRVAEAWEEAEGRLEEWGAAREKLLEAEAALAHLLEPVPPLERTPR